MKSALVLFFEPPIGGAQRRFYRAFQHMTDKDNLYLIINQEGYDYIKKHEPSVISSEPNHFLIFDTKMVKILRHRKLRRVKYIIWLALLFMCLYKHKIWHIHFPANPNLFTFVFSRLYKKKYRISLSIVNSNKGGKKDFSKTEWFFWIYSIKNAILIDVLSKSIYNNMINIYGNGLADKLRVTPCSFTDYSLAVSSKDRPIDICFASRFVQFKGIDLLFDSLMLMDVKTFNNRLIVHICGSGPLENYIKKRSRELKNLDIEIYYANNMFEVFSRTKIFVSLQERENYPSQAILEAAAQKVAIVATDVGDTHLIVDSNSGILVPRSADKIAEALYLLLSDQELITVKGENAYTFVCNNHTVERFVEYLSDFMDEAKSI